MTSEHYSLAARHSDEAFRHNIPKLEAYASLDELHEQIFRSTPTIRTVVNSLLSLENGGQKISNFKTISMLQNLLTTQDHCDYVVHALDALPYLFDVQGEYVCGLQPSFARYLLDESRSGPFCVKA